MEARDQLFEEFLQDLDFSLTSYLRYSEQERDEEAFQALSDAREETLDWFGCRLEANNFLRSRLALIQEEK